MTTFLINPHTGSIDTAKNWQEELGDEFGAAQLEEIGVEPIGQAELTNRVFAGWWGDAKEGDEYIAEWEERYTAENGQAFAVVYHFTQVKGADDEPDCLPWDEDHIWTVKTDY